LHLDLDVLIGLAAARAEFQPIPQLAAHLLDRGFAGFAGRPQDA
jgi:hypothetical protein